MNLKRNTHVTNKLGITLADNDKRLMPIVFVVSHLDRRNQELKGK